MDKASTYLIQEYRGRLCGRSPDLHLPKVWRIWGSNLTVDGMTIAGLGSLNGALIETPRRLVAVPNVVNLPTAC